MPKNFRLFCITATVLSAPILAQAQDIETPEFESTIETSVNLGIGFIDDVNLRDNGAALALDNVTLLTYGISAEKTLLRAEDYSISGALSGEAGFGEGTNLHINGVDALGDANYQRLQAYGDVVARYDGGDETNWTPFVAAGIGIVEETISLDGLGDDTQSFKELTPKTRFRAGLEKKLSERVTFGVSAGKTVDLD